MEILIAMTRDYAAVFDAAVDAAPPAGSDWAETGLIQRSDVPHSGERSYYSVDLGDADEAFLTRWKTFLSDRFDVRKFGVDRRATTQRHFNLLEVAHQLTAETDDFSVQLPASPALIRICQPIFGDAFEHTEISLRSLHDATTYQPVYILRFARSDTGRLERFVAALQNAAAATGVDATELNLVARAIWERFGDEVLNFYRMAAEITGPEGPGAVPDDGPGDIITELEDRQVALNTLIDEIFADEIISQHDLNRIHAALFDEQRPFLQPAKAYGPLKDRWQKAPTALRQVGLPEADVGVSEGVAKSLELLFGDYPGSLERYRMALSRAGLPQPLFAHNLPRTVINAVFEAPDRPGVLVMDVDIGNVNEVYEIDVASPAAMGDLLSRTSIPTMNDALEAFIQYDGDLDPSVLRLRDEFRELLSPYPSPQMLSSLYAGESTQATSALFIPPGKDLGEDGLSADDVVNGAADILGESLAGWFADIDLLARSIARDAVVETRQMEHLEDPQARLYSTSAAATYSPSAHAITMNSFSNGTSRSEYTEVHELAHALNFFVQAPQTTWYQISTPDCQRWPAYKMEAWPQIRGVQPALFAWNLMDFMAGDGDSLPYYRAHSPATAEGLARTFRLPSNSAFANQREWFAELATHYLLERAGRLDVLRASMDHHPDDIDSLFAVDPLLYLIIDKIITTIENRERDPVSYQHLMQTGLDEVLVDAAIAHLKDTGVWETGSKSHVTTTPDGYAQIDPSAGLEDWRTQPLSEMEMTGEWLKIAAAQRDFYLQVLYRTLARPARAGSDKHYVSETLRAIPDAWAIEIAAHLRWDRMNTEQEMRYLANCGLRNRVDLEALYDSFSFFTREDLAPYFPTPEYMDLVWAFVQEEARRIGNGEEKPE